MNARTARSLAGMIVLLALASALLLLRDGESDLPAVPPSGLTVPQERPGGPEPLAPQQEQREAAAPGALEASALEDTAAAPAQDGDAPLPLVRGRLVSGSDDQPVPWAHVVLCDDSPAVHAQDADAQGGFLFASVFPGRVRLAAVSADGALGVNCGPFLVEPDGELDLGPLRLTATGAVRGAVLDPAGNPLACACVSLRGAEQTTDSSGAFSFPHVARGEALLEAEAEGHERGTARVFVGASDRPVTIRLAPAAAIFGRVMDATLVPVVGARVMIPGGDVCLSDERGEFLFTIVPHLDDPFSIWAEHETQGFAHCHAHPGQEATVVLEGGAAFTGIVAGAAPGARPRVEVERHFLSCDARAGFLPDAIRTSGVRWTAEDRFQAAGLEPGARYRVIVTGAAGASAGVDFTVPAPAPHDPITETLLLQPSFCIEGRVLDCAGAPVPGARLRLVEERPETALPGAETACRTEADGAFRFTCRPRVPHRLHVRATGYPLLARAIEPPAQNRLVLDLVLPASASVAGTVRGWEDDSGPRPIVSLRMQEHGILRRALPDEQGAFRFDCLPAGYARVTCELDVSGALVRALVRDVRLAEGDHAEVAFDLAGLQRADLRVRMARIGGERLPGTRVFVANPARDFQAKVETDASGTAALSGLLAGSYEVLAGAPGMVTGDGLDGPVYAEKRTVELAPGAENEVEFALALGSLEVTVSGAEGAALDWVRIQPVWLDEPDLDPDTFPGYYPHSDGAVHWDNLPAGRYTLRVEARDFRARDVPALIITNGATAHCRIALEPLDD
ncbi:MAG: carboxypeptidase regulatory-like domain-containing protein [Planctomycetes bacterium]|nr:carboxypeptidase regulatory-like domain-containing protein [Planctomycetota bacterium]